jgi:hypothetical protein
MIFYFYLEKKEIPTTSNSDLVDIVRKIGQTTGVLSVILLVISLWSAVNHLFISNSNLKHEEVSLNSSSSSKANDHIWVPISRLLVLILLSCLFFLSRITTIRLLQNPNREINFFHSTYHTEVDEIIFESLVSSVLKNSSDYSLQTFQQVSKLELADENYNYPVFHHPPIFVYLSAYLMSHFRFLSLPLLSILYQYVVFLLLPVLSHSLLSSTVYSQYWWEIGVKAQLIWLVCPIAGFCSQKFWIDNCLVMMTMIGMTMYIRWMDWMWSKKPFSILFSGIGCFLMGFFSFGIAVNTKVTSVGLLPCMVLYAMYCGISAGNEDTEKQKKYPVFKIIFSSILLGIGCVSSHFPWMHYYYVRGDF